MKNKSKDKNRTYIAIDLKSFYASVECMERNLDPMKTNLVVADNSRTDKTICLAVSPSLKSFGIPGRPRLFEVIQKVKVANASRKQALNSLDCKKINSTNSNTIKNKDKTLTDSSFNIDELNSNPNLAIDYVVAPPRMAHYLDYSTRIYDVYLKYISHDDIHVYSIDEVFMDVTNYLTVYNMTPLQLAQTIINDVLETTGITATAGIGSNLYLCKIAMDIVAKKMKPDKNGVRIARLDEMSYRENLWNHKPLTDFWRIGKGYANKLSKIGIYTMGDIARCSIGSPTDYYNEDLLYKTFGVNAELLIDHAWGYEPCTIEDVKNYSPTTKSINSGQVLHTPYSFEKTMIVLCEMMELLALKLVEKKIITNQIVLTIGYDIENLQDPERKKQYTGEITVDGYGRKIPKHAHGTTNFKPSTSSTKLLTDQTIELYKNITNPNLLIRRISISANNLVPATTNCNDETTTQLDFFTDYSTPNNESTNQENELFKEKQVQETMLNIKERYGKNSILKGINLTEGATTKDRNNQIGGHKA